MKQKTAVTRARLPIGRACASWAPAPAQRALLFILLLGLCLAWVNASSSRQSPDVASLIEASRDTLESDLQAWAHHSFQRSVLRERLDKNGKVEWEARYHFEVTPQPGGFDERLLRINGEVPKRREIETHRRAGRFEKHYRAASAAKLNNPLGEDLPLAPLLFDQEHTYRGLENIGGVPCFRLVFHARPAIEGATTEELLKRTMRGSLCLSVQGAHLVEADVESVRPVTGGLLRLNHMALRFESRPSSQAWLPRLFEVRTNARLGFVSLRKRNRYEYSGYRLSQD